MFFAKYWPEIIATVVVGFFVSLVSYWHHRAAQVPALESHIEQLQAEQRATLATFERYRTASENEFTRVTTLSEGYQHEIETLRARPRGGPVWVCDNPGTAPGAGVPAAGTAAPGSDDAPTAPGMVFRPMGRDIGPETDALMQRAEELAGRLRLAQAWARTLPKCEPIPSTQ